MWDGTPTSIQSWSKKEESFLSFKRIILFHTNEDGNNK
jgi:hypothetical protein